MHRQDSLQILLDIDADAPWDENNIGGNKYQGHRLVSYGFARKRDGGCMSWVFRAYSDIVKGGPAAYSKAKVLRLGPPNYRTVYQIYLPWKALGSTEAPDMNSSIGFAAVLNDFDGQKRTRLPFFHGVDNLNDAKNGMGKIKFYLK